MFNTRNLWVLAAAGVLLAGGFLLVSNSVFPKQSSIEFISDPPPESSGEGEEPVAEIYVEIAGAVDQPGVYHLSVGSRVFELIEQAGGFSPKADSAWVDQNLNQAAQLSDGTKIYIPAEGERNVPTASSGGSAGVVSGVSTPTSGLININTASAAQLDSLPGIGSGKAQGIIDNRPYQSIDGLLKVSGIGSKTLEKIRERVTVR
ncbi:ComEA family DNA-binding protein [Candidatus Parcubacteria bacterium]|nr:ComEA family DNA-binding protein [Candidatus Parcubacteria bacterium]